MIDGIKQERRDDRTMKAVCQSKTYMFGPFQDRNLLFNMCLQLFSPVTISPQFLLCFEDFDGHPSVLPLVLPLLLTPVDFSIGTRAQMLYWFPIYHHAAEKKFNYQRQVNTAAPAAVHDKCWIEFGNKKQLWFPFQKETAGDVTFSEPSARYESGSQVEASSSYIHETAPYSGEILKQAISIACLRRIPYRQNCQSCYQRQALHSDTRSWPVPTEADMIRRS